MAGAPISKMKIDESNNEIRKPRDSVRSIVRRFLRFKKNRNLLFALLAIPLVIFLAQIPDTSGNSEIQETVQILNNATEQLELKTIQTMLPNLEPIIDTTEIPEGKLFWDDSDSKILIDELIAAMTDEELLAQVFLVGWEGEAPSQAILSWLEKRNLGGIKIFGWNANNVQTLARTIYRMQELALNTNHGIPLIVATDQEGGIVRHVKGGTSITPGNMAIGASSLPYDALLTGFFIGRELRSIGVNMNLAPTVDVYVNPEATVIGSRAFSSDPELTSILGLAFYRGLEETRVIAAAKHFPGHGNAVGDSHLYTPVINDSLEDLEKRDLLPFELMIEEGLPAVLSGHLSFPKITDSMAPASLHSFFKQTILRERWNFEGLVITDDLYMDGALEYGKDQGWNLAGITLEALKAGNDMVMLSQTPGLNEEVWKTVLEEYQSNSDFKAQIQDSVRRILQIKLEYLKPSDRVPLLPEAETVFEFMRVAESQSFFETMAARSVSLITEKKIPLLDSEDQSVLLVGQDPDFINIGREYYPNARTYFFSYSPIYEADPEVIAELQSLIPNYDYVIFNLINDNSKEVLESLEAYKEKVIVMSILTPVYLKATPWVEDAIAVFGWGKESFDAGFAVIHGDISAMGTLPISFDLGQNLDDSKDQSPENDS
jgi:beta-N-acetylhexosaminidase